MTKCLRPYIGQGGAFGCGQCVPCRWQRSRVWAHRIVLESMDHAENSFITLTYGGEATSLNPEHTQKWLKRFRKSIAPRRVRYFLVGEYGENSYRPHYHVAMFGFGHCRGNVLGDTRGCQCLNCSVVRETWGFGHVMVGTLGPKSASYIAGYVTGKLTKPALQKGCHPEFQRMSLGTRGKAGGIGANAMWDVASEMMHWNLDRFRDAPGAVRHDARLLPVGRYLRRKVRKMCGQDEAAPETEETKRLAERLRIVRQYAWDNNRSVRSVFEEFNQPYASEIAFRLSLKGKTL